LKVWDEGKDNFKNDPPNANETILGKTEGATNVVVELSNPRLKGQDLIGIPYTTNSDIIRVAVTLLDRSVVWYASYS
jgi:hypothetical protein